MPFDAPVSNATLPVKSNNVVVVILSSVSSPDSKEAYSIIGFMPVTPRMFDGLACDADCPTVENQNNMDRGDK
jgi:hypothetical protein